MINQLRNAFEQLRDEWDLFMWRSSSDYREMVQERLELHKKAMINGTKSPYFD